MAPRPMLLLCYRPYVREIRACAADDDKRESVRVLCVLRSKDEIIE